MELLCTDKVASIRLRTERMTEQMDEEAGADFWGWFAEQDARIVKVFFRKMAGVQPPRPDECTGQCCRRVTVLFRRRC